jgi:hypothetical protein
LASQLRSTLSETVIDPSCFSVTGYTQTQYDELCARVLKEYVGTIILAPGWQFSRGSRAEVQLATTLRLAIQYADGTPTSPSDLVATTTAATAYATGLGLDADTAGTLLPPIEFR